MQELGYHYRITDIQQHLLPLSYKISSFLKRRKEIARRYFEAFREINCLSICTILRDTELKRTAPFCA